MDLKRWMRSLLPSHSPREVSLDEALDALGITQDEYTEILRLRGMTKFERLEELALDGDSSLRSFFSKMTYEWNKFKQDHKGWKGIGVEGILKRLRRLCAEGVDGKSAELAVLAYVYSRLEVKQSSGESEKVKSS